MTETGQTKDVGWEVGVRHTIAAPLPVVWDYLLGPGLPVWLGATVLVPEKGASFRAADDVRGKVLAYTPGTRIRLSWRPDEWDHDSTLQLTVKQAATGTTIAIHQEKLADREERRFMLGHWKEVLAKVVASIEAIDRG